MAFDPEDIFQVLPARVPEACAPQVRIYLLNDGRPPVADLFAALGEYELVLARSRDELVLIRKITMESKERFRLECERVAAILAPLLAGDCCLDCAYDNAAGKTQFHLELRKTGESPAFFEVDPGLGLAE